VEGAGRAPRRQAQTLIRIRHAPQPSSSLSSVFLGTAFEARARPPFSPIAFAAKVGPQQSVRELAMSAAATLAQHNAPHAQHIQSHAHPNFKALRNVVDGDGPALKR